MSNYRRSYLSCTIAHLEGRNVQSDDIYMLMSKLIIIIVITWSHTTTTFTFTTTILSPFLKKCLGL